MHLTGVYFQLWVAGGGGGGWVSFEHQSVKVFLEVWWSNGHWSVSLLLDPPVPGSNLGRGASPRSGLSGGRLLCEYCKNKLIKLGPVGCKLKKSKTLFPFERKPCCMFRLLWVYELHGCSWIGFIKFNAVGQSICTYSIWLQVPLPQYQSLKG